MNKNHRDQTQFIPEKRPYYLYIRYLLSHRQTSKQIIYSLNYIQAPGLHIIQYYHIFKTRIIYNDNNSMTWLI